MVQRFVDIAYILNICGKLHEFESDTLFDEILVSNGKNKTRFLRNGPLRAFLY